MSLPIPGENKSKIVNGRVYRYTYYNWKGFDVIIDQYNGYHLTLCGRGKLPTYEDLKTARYKFLPNDCYMAEIFPPKEEFINIHKYARQLYQVNKEFNPELL